MQGGNSKPQSAQANSEDHERAMRHSMRQENMRRLQAMRDYLKGAVGQLDQELARGRNTPVDKELARTRCEMLAKLREMEGH